VTGRLGDTSQPMTDERRVDLMTSRRRRRILAPHHGSSSSSSSSERSSPVTATGLYSLVPAARRLTV